MFSFSHPSGLNLIKIIIYDPKTVCGLVKKGPFLKNQHVYLVSTQSFQQNLVWEPQNLFFFFFPYRIAGKGQSSHYKCTED